VIEDQRPGRIAVVVHPTRAVDRAMGTVNRWAAGHGLDVVQLPVPGKAVQEVAARGTLEAGDLVVALGGDGTVLAALRETAGVEAAVLGVACGSLGALSTVSADELAEALERVRAGDWIARSLPALAIRAPDAPDDWAVNDFVVARRGAGQIFVEVAVDDELYVRLAGDGLIVATPFGSSAYSMAAGGPVLAADAAGFVCTPLAMHGGSAPPLIVRAGATLSIEVRPGNAGFDVEIDGHRRPLEARSYSVTMHEGEVTLVTFSPPGPGLDVLRRRGLIADSPRILAQDDRARRAASAEPGSR
jgi:NAD+ kinase